MSIHDTYDVIVIGGGPAGMMAAGQAAFRGLRVLLIEKNPVLGKKLSMTGGGRCNITNAEFDRRILLSHYGDAEQFLYSPFTQFGVAQTFSFFESHKLPLVVQERKRAFPETQRAIDVTAVMQQFIEQAGVKVLLNTSVLGFVTHGNRIEGVKTTSGIYSAKALIVASGGKSHADTGSTGEGISWLSKIGHTIHESNPNLVPLVVSDSWVKKLSGTTLTNTRITFIQGKEKIKKEGNILFTHFGLSGPLILNSAHQVKKMLTHGKVTATIDLFPKEDVGVLRLRFQKLSEMYPNKTLINALKEWFPKGIIDAIFFPFPNNTSDIKMNSLPRDIRYALIDRMKNISITISGTMGYDWAVVSDGGVDLREVDTRTMQSKIHPNLYFVGDVLHINRPSGGYSLQLCWTTGFVAGNNILR